MTDRPDIPFGGVFGWLATIERGKGKRHTDRYYVVVANEQAAEGRVRQALRLGDTVQVCLKYALSKKDVRDLGLLAGEVRKA